MNDASHGSRGRQEPRPRPRAGIEVRTARLDFVAFTCLLLCCTPIERNMQGWGLVDPGPPSQLAVTVVNKAGQPVPEATVVVGMRTPQRPRPDRHHSVSAKTNATGVASLALPFPFGEIVGITLDPSTVPTVCLLDSPRKYGYGSSSVRQMSPEGFSPNGDHLLLFDPGSDLRLRAPLYVEPYEGLGVSTWSDDPTGVTLESAKLASVHGFTESTSQERIAAWREFVTDLSRERSRLDGCVSTLPQLRGRLAEVEREAREELARLEADERRQRDERYRQANAERAEQRLREQAEREAEWAAHAARAERRRHHQEQPPCRIAQLKLEACRHQAQITQVQRAIDRERQIGLRSGYVDRRVIHDGTAALIHLEEQRADVLRQLREDYGVAFSISSSCDDDARPEDLEKERQGACDRPPD